MTSNAFPARTTVSPIRRQAWVRGPFWDGFFMLSVLWLAPLIWLLGRGHEYPEDSPIDSVYLVLTAVFWIGHRVSSAYLAYCTTAYRPLLRTQRSRFVWGPLGIIVLVFAILLPEGVWPWTRAERLMALVILDYGLIIYHFASQHYGILALYRVRAGQLRTRWAKRIDRWFALGVGGVLVIVAEAFAGTVFFQEIWLDPIVDPEWLEAAYGQAQVLGTVAVVLATIGMLGLEALGPAPSVPRALYVSSVSLVVGVAFWVSPFVFIVLWTVQHWVAAMGLATVVARGDPEPGPSLWYRFWHGVSLRPWLLLFVLGIVSTLLLPVMELEAVEEGERYSERFIPALMDVLTNSGVAPTLVAFAFVTAFLHYQLDRAVFRLSNPEVRRAVAKMLGP